MAEVSLSDIDFRPSYKRHTTAESELKGRARYIQKEWKKMNDTITQTRLSMRLDAYLREYTGKKVSKDHLYSEEWDIVWQVADFARTKSTLTPELVDDVRIVLKKL